MKTYSHLNKEERKVLANLLAQKASIRQIARALNRSPATLSRELRRNLTAPNYHPLHAEYLARLRHRSCHRRLRLKSWHLRRQVESWIRLRWSPELIAGRLNRQLGRPQISHEAIYQWLYTEARHLIPCLPRRHPHRGFTRLHHSRAMIQGRIPVSCRPWEVNRRQKPGHWEVDLIVGKGRAALQVAVERMSRFTCLAKVPDKSAQSSYSALCRTLSKLPPHLRRSLTYDNGIENALHLSVNRRFGTQSFFCWPGHAWEKPTVENTNGLIRWFLPKRSNLDLIRPTQIRKIQAWLNSRPRKCLQFQTPAEALSVALHG